jgi:glycosyltransferase involved in cell wall biosynthesis
MYDLSVIVPTHNRAGYLASLLANLASQRYPAERWELVIVDDGSTDGTRDYLETYDGPKPKNTRLVSKPQGGVATARNHGARIAEGRALLFLDDDMIASPTLVTAHAEVHQEDPRAVVIGHLNMPEEGRAPWVAWEDDQLSRHYEALGSGRRVPGPRDLYTGNCSVAAALFAAAGGFDVDLPRTEDVDLGYKLVEVGARFYYRKAADSLHLGWHPYAAWLRNARLYGRCDVQIGWTKGNAVVRGEIFRWYNGRHRLNRALVSTCMNMPALEGPITGALHAVGRALYRLGARSLSLACYSAIYNLAYWTALIREVGPDKFWPEVAAAAERMEKGEPGRLDKLGEGGEKQAAPTVARTITREG